jgi:Flp pilus assembly protein TadG
MLDHLKTWLQRFVRRALGEKRGNVAMIAAFCMVPLTLVIGMGVDYTLQKRSQDQLAGIADAAALVAVTPTAMAESISQAQAQAQAFYNAQSATVSGVTGLTGTVTVTEAPSGAVLIRTAVVNWSGKAANSFAGLTGLSTSPLAGTSSAVSNRAPQVNFYMLIDTSPSMGIVASNSVTAMMNATKAQEEPNGCAFACHESNPNLYPADVVGNPGGEDNYTLARQLGLTLRIDLVNYAVSDLLTTAATTATSNKTTYGVSISTIDYQVGHIYQTSNITTPANLAAAKAAVAPVNPTTSNPGIQQLEVAYNNCLTITNCNPSNAGSDQDSNLDLGLATLGTFNPTSPGYNTTTGPGYNLYVPGSGTTNAGDTPQEVLFIITDGMDDWYYNGNRTYVPINTVNDYCAAIKSKGVRIAFLYLYYTPLTTDSWYMTHNTVNAQPQIATAAQNCASPGLYTMVTSDTDVSSALTNLFQKVVATARLTQ